VRGRLSAWAPPGALGDLGEGLRLEEAQGAALELDEPLLAEVAEGQVHRLARHPDEVGEVALAETQRQQDAVVVPDAVVAPEVDEGLGQPGRRPLEEEPLDPVPKGLQPEAHELGHPKREVRERAEHLEEILAGDDADERVVVGLRHVVPRRVVEDGLLPEDLALAEEGQDHLVAALGQGRDLHHTTLEEVDAVAGLPGEVEHLLAADLAHDGALLHEAHLLLRYRPEEIDVLQIPELAA
jgi:hypothetical protein